MEKLSAIDIDKVVKRLIVLVKELETMLPPDDELIAEVLEMIRRIKKTQSK